MTKLLHSFVFLIAATPLVAQQSGSLTAKQIFEKTAAATATILSGEGAGRLSGIATGVLISRDGVLLTALHAVKGSAEVQVRLANGDVFDRVELLGFDERRDVAALKITATGLPFLEAGSTQSLAQGDPVYAVTSADGLPGSATEGILSAVRPAAEVSGAGAGFRLLQFSAPVAPGASGGALVNREGALVGIITRGLPSAAFAVPIESVLGLSHLQPSRSVGRRYVTPTASEVGGRCSAVQRRNCKYRPDATSKECKDDLHPLQDIIPDCRYARARAGGSEGLAEVGVNACSGPQSGRPAHRYRSAAFYICSHLRYSG